MSDEPQTFVAYTWGPYAKHRSLLWDRTVATSKAVMPVVGRMINSQFGIGAPIFPGTRFPGRLLERAPSQ